MDRESRAREILEGSFGATLPERISRYNRLKRHPIVPDHHFTPVFVECRELFVAGHFYGCITLAQGVAEALSRFVTTINGLRPGKDPPKRFADLFRKGLISQAVRTAFDAVWGTDRNDFHHLNPNIERDSARLEARAEAILSALEVIKSEIFSFTTRNGAIVPTQPRYWQSTTAGTVAVYVDFEGG